MLTSCRASRSRQGRAWASWVHPSSIRFRSCTQGPSYPPTSHLAIQFSKDLKVREISELSKKWCRSHNRLSGVEVTNHWNPAEPTPLARRMPWLIPFSLIQISWNWNMTSWKTQGLQAQILWYLDTTPRRNLRVVQPKEVRNHALGLRLTPKECRRYQNKRNPI